MLAQSLSLLVALVLLAAQAAAAPRAAAAASAFYLSAAGDDANSGRAPDQAWRTLARLQSELDVGAIHAGDQVLFARGGVFTGSLTLGAATQGAAAAPIVFSSYGSGAAPVISGLAALNGWQALGNNRWRTVCDRCTGTPSFLLLDGQPQALARWPNLDEADHGYRYYTAFSGRNSITDAALSGANWAGGEAVVRSIAWVLDRLPIASQSGGTLTFGAPASYDIQAGYGYFIQNHLDALDRDGEWVYDPAAKTITLQLSADPNARALEIPEQANLLTLRNTSHIIFRGLDLRGAARDIINADSCADVVFDQLNLRFNGGVAVSTGGCSRVTLSATSARDSMNVGLLMTPCAGCLVTGVTLERVGLFAGMGGSGDGQYFGAILGGDNFAIDNSVVRDIGYVGISFYGRGTVRNNLVSGFNRVKIDGAGIYMWHQSDVAVLNNIVRDAAGSSAGTPWTGSATNGIYIDDDSERVTVQGNSVANVSGAGIYLHNTRDVTVTGNLIYNPGEAGLQMTDDTLGAYGLERSLIRQNRFLVRGAPAIAVQSSVTAGVFTTLGTIDANVFCDPFDETTFRVELPGSGGRVMPLAQWRAEHGRDANSTQCADRYASRVVTGTVGANRVGNGVFDSSLEGWFGWPDDTLDARWETGRLDGGSLLLGYKGPAPTLHFDNAIGAVQAGQTYRLRVDAKRVAGAPALTAYLRQSGAPYAVRSQTPPVFVDDTRRTFEIFLDTSANESDTLLIFELNAPGGGVALDNVQLQQVTAPARVLSDVARFDANPSAQAQTLTLDSFTYRDLSGAAFPAGASLLLPPYGASVLLRGAAATPGPATPGPALPARAYVPVLTRH